MAGAVDTRIVQMQFDNKDFERNIKTSDESLSKFKKNLDFDKCEKSLSEFGRAVKNLTFDGLVDNVQKLADKFTGLGDISEMVISRIRSGIESAVSKVTSLVNSLGFEQVEAGLDKFSKMNKNVQTIMAATGRSEEEVMTVMKRLNEYTDQTSYNFTDMAANIGKFTSVGIPLEEAEKQMEGIANWAARSGAGIQEASRAMYNLSQAMGVGKLTKIDWKSIENAGMATKEFKEQLIQAGIAAGKLEIDKSGVVKTAKSLGKQVEVSYKNVAETLQKGWADTNVIGATLQKYYYEDLYYEHGEEAILSLSDTQKEAFDKMMKTSDKLNAENYKTLENMGVWTEETKQKILDLAVSQGKLTATTDAEGKKQYEAIGKNGKKIQFTINEMQQSLTAGWFDKGLYETATSINELAKASYEAAQKCMTLSDVFDAWKDQLSTGWMKFWQHVFGDLSESMELFSTICNKVGDEFSAFIRILVGDGDKVEGIMGAWSRLGGRESLWSMLVGEYDDMYEGAYGFLDVLKDIGKMISDGFWMMIKIMNPDLSEVSDEDWLANETYRTQELGFMLKDAIDKVKGFIQGIKDFMNAVPAGQTKTRFQIIQDIVNGAFNTLTIVFNSIRDVIGFISELFGPQMLGPVIDDIVGIFRSLGNEITKTADATSRGKGLKAFLDNLIKIFVESGLIDAIKSFSSEFRKLFDTLIGADQEGSKTINIWETVTKVLSKVASVISRVAAPIVKYIGMIVGGFKDLTSGKIDFKQFAARLKAGFIQMLNSIFSFTPNFTGKVSGIFSAIKNVFTSGFSKESLEDLWARVKELFDAFKAKLPGSVKDTVKGIYGSIKTFAINIWEKIKNLFRPFFDSIKNLFTKGFTKENIAEVGKQFKAIFVKIGDKLPAGIKESATNILARIENALKGFWEKVKEKFTSIFGFNKDEATDALEGEEKPVQGAVAKFFTNLKEWFGGFVGEFKGELKNANLFSLIKEWLGLGLLGKFIGGLTGILKGTNMYAIIMSFLGGYALFKLIKLLRQGTGLVKNVKGFFGGLSDALKDGFKLKFDNKTESTGDKFLKIAKALALIVAAVVVLGMVPLNKLIQGGIALAVIIGILTGFMYLLKHAAADFKQTMSIVATIAAMGLAITGISVGLAILLLALKPLANMSFEGIGKMLLGLAGILIMIGVFSKIVSRQENGIKVKGVLSFAGLAIAIGVLVFALKPLANMEWGGLLKMGVGLAAILFMLSTFTKKVSFMNGSGMGQMIMIAGAIWILLEAIKPLATFGWEDLGKMGAGLAVLMFILTKFTTDSASMKDTGMVNVLIVAGAIALLLEVLKPLAGFEWEQLGKMAAGMAFMVAMVIVLTRLIKPMKDLQAGLGSGAIMLGLVAVIASFALLALTIKDVSWDQLMVAGVMIIAVIAVYALLIEKITKGKQFKNVSKAAAILVMMAGLAVVIVAFGAAMRLVKGIDPAAMVAFGIGLTAIIVGMAAAIKLLSNVPVAGALKGILVLAGGLAALMLVISLLAPLVIGSIGSALTDLSANLAVMASMLEMFSGRMNNFDESSIDKTENVLNRLKDLFGELLGFIGYKTNIDAFTTVLFDLGTTLENFSYHLNNAGDLSNNSAIQLIKDLAGCANDLDTITKLNIDTLTTKITGLGGAMMLYARGVKAVAEEGGLTGADDIDESAVTAAVTLMKNISEKLADENGVVIPEQMPSTDEIGLFGAQLAALAGALIQFEEAGAGLGQGAENGLNVLDQFAKLKAKLDETSFVESYNAVTGSFTKEKINTDTLSEFGKNIESLGSALKTFSDRTNTVDEETGEMKPLDFTPALETLGKFVEFKDNMPEVDGLWQLISGKKESIAKLGVEMESFGQSLNALSKSVTGTGENGEPNYNPLTTSIVSIAVDDMIAMMEIVRDKGGKIGGLVDAAKTAWEGRSMQLSDLKTQMEYIGQGLEALGTSLKNGHWDEDIGADKALDSIETIMEIMEMLNTWNTDPSGNAHDYVYRLGEFLSEFGSSYSNSEELPSIAQLIVKAIGQIHEAFKEYGDIDPKEITMFQNMASALWNLSNVNPNANWELIGTSIADGVKAGIDKGTSGVIDAATQMAIASYNAARKALKINSPSLLFQEGVGEQVGAGYATGIDKSSTDVMSLINSLSGEAGLEGKLDLSILTQGDSGSTMNLLSQLTGENGTGGTLNLGFLTDNQNGSTLSLLNQLTGSEGADATLNLGISTDGDTSKLLEQITGLTQGEEGTVEVGTTPVVDMTNSSQNQGFDLMGMFSQITGMNLNGSNSYATQAEPADYSDTIEKVRVEVANMRSDLRTLAEAMRQTKFVFQSGQVVAAIGPDMDAYLAEHGYWAYRSEIP